MNRAEMVGTEVVNIFRGIKAIPVFLPGAADEHERIAYPNHPFAPWGLLPHGKFNGRTMFAWRGRYEKC